MKKLKKNFESDFSKKTIPTIEDDPLVEWSSIIARIIVGANPYLDISMVHILVMDGIAAGIDQDNADLLGEKIAKKARITLPTDSYGGPH